MRLKTWARRDPPSSHRATGVSLWTCVAGRLANPPLVNQTKLRLSSSSHVSRSIGNRDPPSEGPRRPAKCRCSGGRFLRPVGSPLRPVGSAGRGARLGPWGPSADPRPSSSRPPSRKRDRDAPSDPAVLPRSPLPGGGTAKRGRHPPRRSGASRRAPRFSNPHKERSQPLQLPISLGRAQPRATRALLPWGAGGRPGRAQFP